MNEPKMSSPTENTLKRRPKPPPGYGSWLSVVVNDAAIEPMKVDPDAFKFARKELATLRSEANNWREWRECIETAWKEINKNSELKPCPPETASRR